MFEKNSRKYLFSVNVTTNRPIIKYREIISNISGIVSSSNEENDTENLKIPKGNCVMNYFFYCFVKYSLIGAVEYRRKDKIFLKLGFFPENDKINELKEYIQNLVLICQKYKTIHFEDINFNIIDEKNKFNKKNISIEDLIIKVLEITPIQIAKIMDKNFIIMNNWYNFEKDINVDEDYEPSKYVKMINFCIKDSIFNYFEYPVIVICCFGTQSIGKSTFLNELTGSFFNVSGMRCTEGIWMNIRLFKNNEIISEQKCQKNCGYCSNKCCLFMNHKNICICKNCICGSECILKNYEGNCLMEEEYNELIKCSYMDCNCLSKCNCICNKNNHKHKCIKCEKEKKNECLCKCICWPKGYCCLQKGHENFIKCSIKNCKCICKCKCECKSQHHEHLCQKCKKANQNECSCKCACIHLCTKPIINHNFICVSLDFEGLGSIERYEKQDIKMALVGSAIGNSVLYRTGSAFDRFTNHFLDQISIGSKEIQFKDNNQFFGGSLFFSPKDINELDKEKVKEEFYNKIDPAIKVWNENSSSQLYNVFGLFDEWNTLTTSIYGTEKFYENIRNGMVNSIIEETLKYKKNPVYKNGNQFSENLKLFLAITYMNNYQILQGFTIKKIDKYIDESEDDPFEILGILDKNIKNEKLIIKNNGFELYINNKYIKKLKSTINNENKFFNHENKLIVNDLILEPSKISCDIDKEYNINNTKIKFKISKKENNTFFIEIINFDDFGLILRIPKNISKEITIEKLCEEYYKLWDKIAIQIGLNEETATNYFSYFMNSLIKRRKDNLSKWLQEITDNNKELLEKYNSKFIKEKNNWIFCDEKCKKCEIKCYLIKEHKTDHQCFYDHKCKMKCEICSKRKCEGKNCEINCINVLNHKGVHTCGHRHLCLNPCIYIKETKCQEKCILEYGHEDQHYCGIDYHQCKIICDLNTKAKNCKGECILQYPHEGKSHFCGSEHLCKENCEFKNKSKGCEEICKKNYGHVGEHRCNGFHLCKENCYLNEIANGCGGKCSLEYPHTGQHNCNNEHKCNEKCKFENLNGCGIYCNLKYGHEGLHICGSIHFCKEKCSVPNCKGICIYKFDKENKHEHFCQDKAEHPCLSVECYLKNDSINCEKICSLKYGHEGNHICKIKKNLHICNKKCTIKKKCEKECQLPANHKGYCACGDCNCPHSCKYKDISNNCNGICQYKAGHKEFSHLCSSEQHLCKEICRYANESSNCNKDCKLPLNHPGEHICDISNHYCNGECQYYKLARNCLKNCFFMVGHKSNHMCNSSQHLCPETCFLFNKSRGCQKLCKLKYNHPILKNIYVLLKDMNINVINLVL